MVRHPHRFAPLDEPAFRSAQEELVGGASASGHPVRHVEVQQAVPVHVGDRGGESVSRTRHPGRRGHVHMAATVIAVEAVPVVAIPAVAGHVEVGITVAVVVEEERRPAALRIEEPGIERGGNEGGVALFDEPVPVERVRVPDAEGDEIEVTVAVQIGPAAAPGSRPAFDPDPRGHLLEAKRRGRAAVRDVEPVALRKAVRTVAGAPGRDHQVPARLEQLGLEVHGLPQRRRRRTGSAHPEQRGPEGAEGGGAVGGLAQHHLEVGGGRRIVPEPQAGDPPPVVLPRIGAVDRDGAGEVVVGAAQAGVAALDVGEADVEVRPGVLGVQRDGVLEEFDGAVVVAEAHHAEAVLEVRLGFLLADVGRAVLPGHRDRKQRQQQPERQRLEARAVHAGDHTRKGRGPEGPRPATGCERRQ